MTDYYYYSILLPVNCLEGVTAKILGIVCFLNAQWHVCRICHVTNLSGVVHNIREYGDKCR